MSFNFWSAFKESDGSWSWARLASTVTLLVSAWAFVHVVRATHAIPDPAMLMGLAGFAVSPYTVNKGLTAFAKKDATL